MNLKEPIFKQATLDGVCQYVVKAKVFSLLVVISFSVGYFVGNGSGKTEAKKEIIESLSETVTVDP